MNCAFSRIKVDRGRYPFVFHLYHLATLSGFGNLTGLPARKVILKILTMRPGRKGKWYFRFIPFWDVKLIHSYRFDPYFKNKKGDTFDEAIQHHQDQIS